MDVPLHDLDAIADPAKDQHAVVVADGHSRLGHAAGDGHRREQGLIELIGPDLGVEVVARLVQREEAVGLLRLASDLVEVTEVVPGATVGSGVAGGRDDLLEIDVDRRLRLLPLRLRVGRDDGRGQRRDPPQLPDATHEALPQILKARLEAEESRMFPSTGPDARP